MNDSNRQDIVDLLFLALYQDNHLSIEEDVMLQKALKSLGWRESGKPELSVGKAFAAVRKANACDETKEIFLAERTLRIREAGTSAIAFEWLGKILGSDSLDPREEHFMKRVEKMLFV